MGEKHQSQIILEPKAAEPELPPMYRVMLLNDDYTPMDFVIIVLQRFFALTIEQATQVMLKVHYDGRGLCGVFTYDIAATKVEQVMNFAAENQHPLKCMMEEDK